MTTGQLLITRELLSYIRNLIQAAEAVGDVTHRELEQAILDWLEKHPYSERGNRIP